jgi:DNA-binding LacI/PurR family transcriptional regulator
MIQPAPGWLRESKEGECTPLLYIRWTDGLIANDHLCGMMFVMTNGRFNLTFLSEFAIFNWKRFQSPVSKAPGRLMPTTIKDVAKKAGVGVGTVSRVFNQSPLVSEETQQRVLNAAQELDYHPDASARRLVHGRTRVIGFVERHSPFQHFADAFMADVLRGLHEVAQQHGYHVLFEPTIPDTYQQDRLLALIRERHADGIILSGPRFDDEQLLAVIAAGLPVVLQGELPGSGVPCVDVDNYGGARLATEHLIRLGHRRIGMITNGPLVYTAAQARKNGYADAMAAAGLATPAPYFQVATFSPESGATAIQALMAQSTPPTAVFVASDTVALGAISALRSLGLEVPGDIAIASFDDIPWAAYSRPALTTIRLPAQEIGRKAGALLLALLDGQEIREERTLLPTELVIRESCGAR